MTRIKSYFSYMRHNFMLCIKSLMLLSIAIMLLLASYSYSTSDNSWFNFTDAESGVNNLLGYRGAWFAGLVLHAFGYSFMIVTALIAMTALKIHIYQGFNQRFMLRMIAAIFCIIPCSILLSQLNHVADGQIISAGGYLGVFLTSELTDYLDLQYVLLGAIALLAPLILFAVNIRPIEIWYAAKFIMRNMLILGLYILAAIQYLVGKVKIAVMRLKRDNEIDDSAHEQIIQEAKQSVSNKIQVVKAKARDAKKSKSINAQRKFVFNGTDFNLPSTSSLNPLPTHHEHKASASMLEQSSKLLSNVLGDFGVKGEILKVSQGPVVTLYEMEPAAGTKSSRVVGLSDDIARSMSAISARIAVISGKNAIGIELPNVKRQIVYLRELLESDEYAKSSHKLPLILGHSISGKPVIADLAKMPHLLVAGTTGSGKSVAINTMILSLLFKHSPQQCKFIMIDPKMLELSVYDGIPHLLAPVVTEPRKAVSALKWVVQEMEQRYKAMSTIGVRNIKGYNEMMQKAAEDGRTLTKKIQTGFDPDTSQPIYDTIEIENKQLPLIVVIVDEMADLMLVAGKDIETYIQRLAQMARAAGIHLIMATQRPSVDVITGVIKANFPTRISFQVTSKIDSRTILGEQGAEQLLGMGDMLYMSGGGRIERVHGPFVSDNEVESIVNYLKQQDQPEYISEVTEMEDDSGSNGSGPVYDMAGGGDTSAGDDAALYQQAVKAVTESQRASISYVQRVLKIGYNRAANLVEQMEKDGIVTPPNHQGKREVISHD